MAGETPNSAASTASTTLVNTNGGGSAQANPNAGGSGGSGDSISIPRSEYDKFVRYGEQVKGFQPFFEKAKGFGIQRPEDFDRLTPYHQTMTELEKRGIKADQLQRMFSADADADLGKGDKPEFDPAAFEKQLESKFERKLAEKEWQTMTAKEKDYVDAALRDVLGDEKVDEMTKSVYRGAVENWLDKNREMYPESHPLHGSHLQPLTEAQAKKAAEYFKAEKAKYAGAAAANKADAAIASEGKKPPSSAAGRSGGQGAPEKKQRSPFEPHDDAAILAQHEARKAQRTAGR